MGRRQACRVQTGLSGHDADQPPCHPPAGWQPRPFPHVQAAGPSGGPAARIDAPRSRRALSVEPTGGRLRRQSGSGVFAHSWIRRAYTHRRGRRQAGLVLWIHGANALLWSAVGVLLSSSQPDHCQKRSAPTYPLQTSALQASPVCEMELRERQPARTSLERTWAQPSPEKRGDASGSGRRTP